MLDVQFPITKLELVKVMYLSSINTITTVVAYFEQTIMLMLWYNELACQCSAKGKNKFFLNVP